MKLLDVDRFGARSPLIPPKSRPGRAVSARAVRDAAAILSTENTAFRRCQSEPHYQCDYPCCCPLGPHSEAALPRPG